MHVALLHGPWFALARDADETATDLAGGIGVHFNFVLLLRSFSFFQPRPLQCGADCCEHCNSPAVRVHAVSAGSKPSAAERVAYPSPRRPPPQASCCQQDAAPTPATLTVATLPSSTQNCDSCISLCVGQQCDCVTHTQGQSGRHRPLNSCGLQLFKIEPPPKYLHSTTVWFKKHKSVGGAQRSNGVKALPAASFDCLLLLLLLLLHLPHQLLSLPARSCCIYSELTSPTVTAEKPAAPLQQLHAALLQRRRCRNLRPVQKTERKRARSIEQHRR